MQNIYNWNDLGIKSMDHIEIGSDRMECKKIGQWIDGLLNMPTAFNFVNIFKIKRVVCSKTINRAENLNSQLIISALLLERPVVYKLYTSKQSKSEWFNHPGPGTLVFFKTI